MASKRASTTHIAAVLLLALLPCAPARADIAGRPESATARYFEGLRQRHLYQLAENYCRTQLARNSLSDQSRVELTVELSRTLAVHATFTTGNEQAELWRRARQVIDEQMAASPASPYEPLLAIQKARVGYTQGEFLRWQAELFPHDSSWATRARSVLDDALQSLTDLEQNLQVSIGRRRTPSAASDDASQADYRGWLSQARPLLGALLIERARLLPADSTDRRDMLARAEKKLRPVADIAVADRDVWQARVHLAEATMLQGDQRKCVSLLESYEKTDPPADVIDRFAAIRARMFLSADAPDDAARLLVRYNTRRTRLSGETRYLQIRAFADLWEIAGQSDDEQLADRLLGELKQLAHRAETEVGGHWGYRSRVLVERMLQADHYGTDTASLVEKSRAHYAAGRFQQAAQGYAKASQLAASDGKSDLAAEFAYTHASILLNDKRIDEASTAFAELVERFPDYSRAADAHLLYAYSLGKTYDRDRTAEHRSRYGRALEDHRRRYRNHPTTAEATWMLALLREHAGDYAQALELYRQIPHDHKRAAAAKVAIARCHEKRIIAAATGNSSDDSIQRQAVAQLQQQVAQFPQPPSLLDRHQAEVALRLARILLARGRQDASHADDLLQRVESSAQHAQRESTTASPAEAGAWKQLAAQTVQLRIVAMAADGRFDEAGSLIDALSSVSPSQLLRAISGLAELSTNSDTTRRALAKLKLRAVEGLDEQRAQLSEAERSKLDRLRADAYLAANQSERAIAIYDRLLEESPRDKSLLKTVANLASHCQTDDCLRMAKSYWRKLEALEKPGSDAWMEARYQVAAASLKLGQHEECKKLLGVTRLLYPNRGSDETQRKLAELAQSLGRQQPD